MIITRIRQICLFLLVSFLISFPGKVQAQTKIFTPEELSTFNGQNGAAVYFAYEGVVYDVTGSRFWEEGQHFGLQAGTDLTGQLGEAPHGVEVFNGFEVMGSYESKAAEVSPVTSTSNEAAAAPAGQAEQKPTESSSTKEWYEGRIRIFGISILGWTGILMGIFFVFTFATCFAMPWAKLPLPWKGARLGHDSLDQAPRRMTWSSIHKYFVWWVVILGVIHGVLGLLQLVGLYL